MIATEPRVTPTGLYEAKAAAEALGISRQTLHSYTRQGLLAASIRKTNGRRVWRGSELIRIWRIIY